MGKYIMKRIGYMFITLFIIATVTFMLVNFIPGDPIGAKAKALPESVQQNIRKKYKLDEPIYVRYGYYLYDLVRGDLGESIHYPGRSVNTIIKDQFPASFKLGIQAVLLGLIIGLPLGIIAAFHRSTWVDYTVMFIAIIGISIPSFVLAVLLQLYVGGKFGLPIAGWTGKTHMFSGFKYTVLPTLSLALPGIASNARFMRTAVLDVINQDYVLMAKSKGVPKFTLVWKHIIKNAMIPVVTILGPRIASIITGTIVVEQLFAVPGLGRELVNAIGNRDYTVVMSLTVFFSFLYVLSLLIVDIIYVLIDPRIKLEATNKK
jgi:oligopeptide transport system permease protein